jgi:hypothetical protein
MFQVMSFISETGYQTTGPCLGGTFNGSALPRQVGAATFTYVEVDGGTLIYVVDGTTVTKWITRTSRD